MVVVRWCTQHNYSSKIICISPSNTNFTTFVFLPQELFRISKERCDFEVTAGPSKGGEDDKGSSGDSGSNSPPSTSQRPVTPRKTSEYHRHGSGLGYVDDALLTNNANKHYEHMSISMCICMSEMAPISLWEADMYIFILITHVRTVRIHYQFIIVKYCICIPKS